ncbi:hypothetical protein ACFLYI_02095 [Chloroflexota bacterium]
MRRYSIFIMLTGIFLSLSGLIYFIHYLIFGDVHHIFIYMVGDLAFLPLEVFLVVIVVERILTRREKHAMLHKLNMVIGSFYSEVGTELLYKLLGCFETSREIKQRLAVSQNWTHIDFKEAVAYAHTIEDQSYYLGIDLEKLRTFFIQKRSFLLALLENPNLLEHEHFTDLLWATFHLAEELEARLSVRSLPEMDLEHIAGDIKRLYGRLAAEWVVYVEHLQSHYPFLFSLVVRTHPFQEHPSAVVT